MSSAKLVKEMNGQTKKRLDQLDETIETLAASIAKLQDYTEKTKATGELMCAKLRREQLRSLSTVAQSKVMLVDLEMTIMQKEMKLKLCQNKAMQNGSTSQNKLVQNGETSQDTDAKNGATSQNRHAQKGATSQNRVAQNGATSQNRVAQNRATSKNRAAQNGATSQNSASHNGATYQNRDAQNGATAAPSGNKETEWSSAARVAALARTNDWFAEQMRQVGLQEQQAIAVFEQDESTTGALPLNTAGLGKENEDLLNELYTELMDLTGVKVHVLLDESSDDAGGADVADADEADAKADVAEADARAHDADADANAADAGADGADVADADAEDADVADANADDADAKSVDSADTVILCTKCDAAERRHQCPTEG